MTRKKHREQIAGDQMAAGAEIILYVAKEDKNEFVRKRSFGDV